jgi:hypothetical protein
VEKGAGGAKFGFGILLPGYVVDSAPLTPESTPRVTSGVHGLRHPELVGNFQGRLADPVASAHEEAMHEGSKDELCGDQPDLVRLYRNSLHLSEGQRGLASLEVCKGGDVGLFCRHGSSSRGASGECQWQG